MESSATPPDDPPGLPSPTLIPPSPSDPMEEGRSSYRQALTRNIPSPPDLKNQIVLSSFVVQESDASLAVVDGLPAVTFSAHAQQCLQEPFKFTVIVKLIDRAIGYNALYTRLLNLWQPRGDLHIIGLNNKFYMVKLDCEQDYMHALVEGPWSILGSYLYVQPWSPSFDADEDTIRSVMAWIRFPGLPIHYYNHSVLQILGQLVG